jgi:transaldolase
MAEYHGPLHEMVMTTPTRFWNDSCSIEELRYAIARGANGATSNPAIVLNVLKQEMDVWKDRIQQVIAENPTWSETQIAWQIYLEIAVNGAKQLLGVHQRENCKFGRLSIQTDPALYRNRDAILQQAEDFNRCAPNLNIKIPATKAGIEMIEESTYRGVSVTVTVSFTVPQVMAAAEAVEKGLERRRAEGRDNSTMSPIVVIMVGRTDDWIKVAVKRDKIDIDPAYLEWPGVACFKNAYRLYQERGYHSRLLSAAYRNFYHWTEFVGGDVSLTIPHEWQVKFNESGTKPVPRMQVPVAAEILDGLYSKIPDFRRAYDEAGMTVDEFDTYGATVRTLRSFIEAWHNFVAVIRDFMLLNPDLPATDHQARARA